MLKTDLHSAIKSEDSEALGRVRGRIRIGTTVPNECLDSSGMSN